MNVVPLTGDAARHAADVSRSRRDAMRSLIGAVTVKGPYKYEGDLHPCFRLTCDDTDLFMVVFDNDGLGEARAQLIADMLNKIWR